MILCLLFTVHLAAPPPTQLFALAIGFNGAPHADAQPLRFADDDAVKNAQLVEELHGEAVLLTTLDATSRQMYPALTPQAPTGAALNAAAQALADKVRAAHAAGAITRVLIFYSGHGDIDHGEGYFQLQDGRLTRSDFHALIKRFPADSVHVIVDACKAYYLVFERGIRDRVPDHAPLFATDPLPSHVGFLLATSAAEDTHEWEAYQGGIFSHEVRSALRGAADLDGDGQITYDEVAAFIFNANRSITNPSYRPTSYVRAPQTDAVLVDLADAPMLRFDAGLSKHWTLEDAQGVRLLDTHPAANTTAHFMLPSRRPLFLREAQTDVDYRIDRLGSVDFTTLVASRTPVQTRGALNLAFAQLFSQAYEPQAFARYQQNLAAAQAADDAINHPLVPRWVAPMLLAEVAATTGVAGIFAGLALAEHHGVTATTPQTERLQVNQRIQQDNAWALGWVIAAGAGAIAYGVTEWVQHATAAPTLLYTP